jgi:hypothetical protein
MINIPFDVDRFFSLQTPELEQERLALYQESQLVDRQIQNNPHDPLTPKRNAYYLRLRKFLSIYTYRIDQIDRHLSRPHFTPIQH